MCNLVTQRLHIASRHFLERADAPSISHANLQHRPHVCQRWVADRKWIEVGSWRTPSQAPHIFLCGQAANEGAEREAGRRQPRTQRTDHVTHLKRYLPRRRHHQHLRLTAKHEAREQQASFMYLFS